MFLFRRKPKTPPVPSHAFCEPATATPTSYWHIRVVGEEGLKFGGGIPGPVLCDSDRMMRGWDLRGEVTPESVAAYATARSGDGRVFVCPACAAVYAALAGPPTTGGTATVPAKD